MIPYCKDCKVELVSDLSVPQKEWRCPKCNKFYEFFDDWIDGEDMK